MTKLATADSLPKSQLRSDLAKATFADANAVFAARRLVIRSCGRGGDHNVYDRLTALGCARRLALAIGDTRFDAPFARWLAALRPLALDARLAALFGELNGRLFW